MSNPKNMTPGNLSADQAANYHTPVLLNESIEGLAIKADGIYVDCTFGGGGHSRAILQHLGKNGKLFAFDQDADAKTNLPEDGRLNFIPQNFRQLQRFLRLHKILQVDGILADLGVSSHQFDEADRGFSIRFDAPMDMRMDQRQTTKAEDVIRSFSELQLHKMFEIYGEVTNAKTLARTIIQQRTLIPIRTVNEFKQAVHEAVKGNPQKYFAQVFQALRIEVNDELGALKELLGQLPGLLKPGGRAAFITFHSLEDRIVKKFFKAGTFLVEEADKVYGIRSQTPFTLITKKPIVPAEAETKNNKRARSAKLRVVERNDKSPERE